MYMEGYGLGMFIDNFHYNLGGRIIALLFLMLVLSSVWDFFFVIVWIFNVWHQGCVIW